MSTLLIRNSKTLVTMDAERREIPDGGLFIRNGVIEIVDATTNLPKQADQIFNMADCVVIPGLINTHHHFYQNLTRSVPTAQDATLFEWLRRLYPIWARMGPEEIRISTKLALAELALSGGTCSSDHLYIFPNGARLDDQIEASSEVGLRLHATRGAMSFGESNGGLPPDILVEKEPAILNDSLRLIQTYHDPSPGAFIRIGLAPCSPFSVSRELMRDTANLAREHGVMLHTHLAENSDDVDYSLEKFGCTPGQYVEDLGWVGEDVWHAHCVKLSSSEIELFQRTGTGIAHCPCSNMRLGSGIAPVVNMRNAGINIGLGVDGSASNDSSNILSEARQAMLLQRVAFGGSALSARDALEFATIGGAKILGRPDLGSLEVGKRADFAAYSTKNIVFSGNWDPVAGLLFCTPLRATHTIVEGRPIVQNGQLMTTDVDDLLSSHSNLTQRLFNGV